MSREFYDKISKERLLLQSERNGMGVFKVLDYSPETLVTAKLNADWLKKHGQDERLLA